MRPSENRGPFRCEGQNPPEGNSRLRCKWEETISSSALALMAKRWAMRKHILCDAAMQERRASLSPPKCRGGHAQRASTICMISTRMRRTARRLHDAAFSDPCRGGAGPFLSCSRLRIRHWHPVSSVVPRRAEPNQPAPADVPLGIGISVCSRSSILKRQTPDPRSLASRPVVNRPK